ncbi:MAG: diacylglycerol/polyprenol kinase family protein [Bacteroidota bacterium]
MSDSAPVISYRAELGRKALHLGALVIPLGILLLDGRTVWGVSLSVAILAPLAALALALDVARVRSRGIRDFLHRWFAWLMRPEEIPPLGGPITFNGATMMCTSAAICAALFPAGIAAAALAMLMVGDGAAAIIGRRFGRHRWPGSPKSVEGSLAYAVTAFGIGLAVVVWPGSGLGPVACLVGAGSGAIVEALPIPLNDNLRVPLLTGLAMWVASSMGL